MMRYNGVSLQEMMNYLSEVDEKFTLEKLGPNEFRCYALGDKHGEYENIGTLFHVVRYAFQPYYKQYKSDVLEKRQEFSWVFQKMRQLKPHRTKKPLFCSVEFYGDRRAIIRVFDDENGKTEIRSADLPDQVIGEWLYENSEDEQGK
ncbi:hypothetical protein [Xenorhabdus cabanillasii]|uniref:Uncharacterized protein n=1 Tax=Xenorhabdus cabanillasii JM26 TaxID=1427517 RepID=W1J5U8_9GAMM|nr:hypothetical protein [Xenorhabdus cabanillasii]PHM76907.1 hypothetical protein Xcab_02474 [Xenorhabdus cabanillasii JM26]CDL85236.1 hypothetical protein XCR1_2190007 [Xenorhabdus cabanillasii JM26]